MATNEAQRAARQRHRAAMAARGYREITLVVHEDDRGRFAELARLRRAEREAKAHSASHLYGPQR